MSVHNGLTCEGADTFLRHATDELKRIREERDILRATVKSAREMLVGIAGDVPFEEAIKKVVLEVAHWKVEWKIDRDSYEEANRKANKFEEQVEYVTEILKAVEWRGFHRNFPEPVCPYCGGEKEQQGHKENCKLGEFLR